MLSYHNTIPASIAPIKILDYSMSAGGSFTTSRTGASVYNDSNRAMYIKFGTEASNSAFTLPLMPKSYWEVPESFKGAVYAVWDSGCTGSAQVTEW